MSLHEPHHEKAYMKHDRIWQVLHLPYVDIKKMWWFMQLIQAAIHSEEHLSSPSTDMMKNEHVGKIRTKVSRMIAVLHTFCQNEKKSKNMRNILLA